jgi:hypothetical protein
MWTGFAADYAFSMCTSGAESRWTLSHQCVNQVTGGLCGQVACKYITEPALMLIRKFDLCSSCP